MKKASTYPGLAMTDIPPEAQLRTGEQRQPVSGESPCNISGWVTHDWNA